MNFLNLSELKQVGKNKDNLRYLCPFCEKRIGSKDHPPGHLHVNLKKGIYHCFRCDAAMSNTYVYLKLTTFQSSKKEEVPKEKRITLPQDFYPLSESKNNFFPMYRDYARSRGITSSEAKQYNVGFTGDLNSPLFGRVIFCHYNEESGKLDFLQGRTVFEDNSFRYYSPGEKPLFKSFKGSVDSGIIVEGIFDMIKIARLVPSAALLQHLISDPQLEQIYKSFRKKIVLALDADAVSSVIPCLRRIKGRDVVPILLRHKDVDELPQSELESLAERV